jgi:precorrin-2 methylase
VRAPQTHFEQIRVAVVKKIAKQFSVKEEIEEPMSENTVAPQNAEPAHQHWRGLAQQIQKETDSQKLIALVQQLIAKYDEEEELREQRRSSTSNL